MTGVRHRLIEPTDRYSWHRDAACRTAGIDMFPHTIEETAAAIAVCARCPVQQTCADYALSTHQTWGCWGGMSEPQIRSHHRNTRKDTACPP